MDDAAVPAHGVKRRRTLAVPDQVGIAIVLENRHAILLREREELGAARLGHDGPGRVLHGRDGVDVFRLDAAPLEVGERLGQRVHPHAVLVKRNADRVDAKPGQPVQRALIGVALDDHGIAAGEQRRVDEVERLQRAGDDQDVIGDAVDAGVALQLAGEEFAQGAIALRAAGKPVGGEHPALAQQHGVDGIDQALDRHAVGIVVAADKAVFGKSRPPRGRCGQPRGQQWREVEGR